MVFFYGKFFQAAHLLDDAQLLNSNLLQPINYASGHNYGVDFMVHGNIDAHWSEYFNYSYSIHQVQGLSGGIFTGSANNFPSNTYVPLDESQNHTANAGLTYSTDRFWWTGQELYGSGLHTGPSNLSPLPEGRSFMVHLTKDL